METGRSTGGCLPLFGEKSAVFTHDSVRGSCRAQTRSPSLLTTAVHGLAYHARKGIRPGDVFCPLTATEGRSVSSDLLRLLQTRKSPLQIVPLPTIQRATMLIEWKPPLRLTSRWSYIVIIHWHHCSLTQRSVINAEQQFPSCWLLSSESASVPVVAVAFARTSATAVN